MDEITARKLLEIEEQENFLKMERRELVARIADESEVDLGRSATTYYGDLKVTVKKGVNYTADFDALLATGIPLDRLPVRLAYKVDVTALKEIEEGEPELYRQIIKFISVQPTAPSVKVKV